MVFSLKHVQMVGLFDRRYAEVKAFGVDIAKHVFLCKSPQVHQAIYSLIF
jgi:hypothetical protein